MIQDSEMEMIYKKEYGKEYFGPSYPGDLRLCFPPVLLSSVKAAHMNEEPYECTGVYKFISESNEYRSFMQYRIERKGTFGHAVIYLNAEYRDGEPAFDRDGDDLITQKEIEGFEFCDREDIDHQCLKINPDYMSLDEEAKFRIGCELEKRCRDEREQLESEVADVLSRLKL